MPDAHYTREEVDKKFSGLGSLISEKAKLNSDKLDGINEKQIILNGKLATIDKWKERREGATGVLVVVTTIFVGVFSWTLLTVVQLKSDVAKLEPDAIKATVQQATADALQQVILEISKTK